MKVGIDGRKIPEAATRGPVGTLDHAHELGLDGVFFRSVLDITPTLDSGVLRDVRTRADELGLYLEAGLGKVNPYAMPEAPELRRVGDGDTLLGFERMIAACARIGVRELWAATANRQPYPGFRSYDRFRTDAPWRRQLEATAAFLRKLRPVALDNDVHVNLETHEEITSHEVVRLVEAVGPDVLGIVYDTSNGLHRAEDPVAVARRVAPYVRQTHLKDAALVLAEGGVIMQSRPVGDGVVDFGAILPIVAAANPKVHLTIECRQPDVEGQKTYPTFTTEKRPNVYGTLVEVYDPEWQAGHPDLTVGEFSSYLALAQDFTDRIDSGQEPTVREIAEAKFGYDEAVEAIQVSARHIRQVLADAA
ncbi:sugar phosphate isomerase/epimerase family protein [Kribbella sp. NPDC059898]|uniref:sugar phosphate isomerase/epimerase family protein n=1 Tax=Kribbella sp. NPDC059898 TaxID=3346995 RepID=UPI0036572B77